MAMGHLGQACRLPASPRSGTRRHHSPTPGAVLPGLATRLHGRLTETHAAKTSIIPSASSSQHWRSGRFGRQLTATLIVNIIVPVPRMYFRTAQFTSDVHGERVGRERYPTIIQDSRLRPRAPPERGRYRAGSRRCGDTCPRRCSAGSIDNRRQKRLPVDETPRCHPHS